MFGFLQAIVLRLFAFAQTFAIWKFQKPKPVITEKTFTVKTKEARERFATAQGLMRFVYFHGDTLYRCTEKRADGKLVTIIKEFPNGRKEVRTYRKI